MSSGLCLPQNTVQLRSFFPWQRGWVLLLPTAGWTLPSEDLEFSLSSASSPLLQSLFVLNLSSVHLCMPVSSVVQFSSPFLHNNCLSLVWPSLNDLLVNSWLAFVSSDCCAYLKLILTSINLSHMKNIFRLSKNYFRSSWKIKSIFKFQVSISCHKLCVLDRNIQLYMSMAGNC